MVGTMWAAENSTLHRLELVSYDFACEFTMPFYAALIILYNHFVRGLHRCWSSHYFRYCQGFFVAVDVRVVIATLPLCIQSKIHELDFFISKATSWSGRLDLANITVLMPFQFSYSEPAASEVLRYVSTVQLVLFSSRERPVPAVCALLLAVVELRLRVKEKPE